jgi:uncharacterized membrane protein YfcA
MNTLAKVGVGVGAAAVTVAGTMVYAKRANIAKDSQKLMTALVVAGGAAGAACGALFEGDAKGALIGGGVGMVLAYVAGKTGAYSLAVMVEAPLIDKLFTHPANPNAPTVAGYSGYHRRTRW